MTVVVEEEEVAEVELVPSGGMRVVSINDRLPVPDVEEERTADPPRTRDEDADELNEEVSEDSRDMAAATAAEAVEEAEAAAVVEGEILGAGEDRFRCVTLGKVEIKEIETIMKKGG